LRTDWFSVEQLDEGVGRGGVLVLEVTGRAGQHLVDRRLHVGVADVDHRGGLGGRGVDDVGVPLLLGP
jgi:hypothetical protein